MASNKFNPVFTTEFSEHILFLLGSEAVNFKPIFISTSDSDDWSALVEGGYFMDELGTGRKVSGARTYFSTESWVNQQITTAVEGLQKEFFFDPTTDTAPTRSDGSVKANDTYIVTADGTFDGQALRKGDILKAKTDVASNPSFSDYYWNEAVSGLEDVPDATTSIKGIVQLVDAIRRDGNASTTLVATEKAVHDALTASETTLNATITAGDTALQGQITTLGGQVSTNSADIASNDSDIADLASDVADRVKYSGTDQSINTNINIGGSSELFIVNYGPSSDNGSIFPSGDLTAILSTGDTIVYKNGGTIIGTETVSDVIYRGDKDETEIVFQSDINMTQNYDFYIIVASEKDLTVTGDLYAKTGEMTESNDKLFMTQSEKDAVTAASTAISTLETEMDAVEAAADAAQSDATQGLTNAATAQSAADAAQSDATQALSDASTAQSAADAAQSDATQALSDASTAQSAADAAQSDATKNATSITAIKAVNTAQGTAISTLNSEMDAVEAVNTTQNSRLTSLETYTQQSVTLTIGNGTDSTINIATGKTWKDANAVTFTTLVSDGGTYKRTNVMNTKYVDPATGNFVMRFASAPATGAYQVIVSGLATAA